MKKYFPFPRLLKKFTHFSSILLTVGAFSYSSTAFADVNGIPYNPDFPNAQNPYAQAPDGCSGWQNTRQVRDTWGRVSFTEACNNHDRCYYTRGSNWNTCNERFYSDLRAACERDLRVWVPPVTVRGVEITPGFHTPPEPATLSACYTVASGYYAGVQAGVLRDVFNEAQDKQRRYEEWVASIRSPSVAQPTILAQLSNGRYEIMPNNQIVLSPSGGNRVVAYNGRQRALALVQYRGAVYTAFDGGGIYRSPDGVNLGGGGNTTRVYPGTQTVKAILSCQDSIFTAFSGGGIYRSPDGQNLGGGGNTTRVYAGSQLVTSMQCRGNSVVTTFSGGGIYESPDGQNLGGGGRTVRLN
jgi:hypothetical protein